MVSKHSARPRWALKCAKAGKDFHIQKQPSRRHNLLNLGAAFLLWAAIFSILIVLPAFSPWIAIPMGGLLLGCCFFGVFILIIHECSHNMFVIGKDKSQTKRLNNIIGRFVSAPFFTCYVQHWEKGHVTHHIRPCEEDDPQNPDPLYGKRLFVRLLKLWLIPFGFLPYNPSSQYPNRFMRTLLGVLFWLPIILFFYSYTWMVLPVVYIGFAVISTLNMLKIAQEHGSGLANELDPLLRSRTYFYNFQWLFSPFCINYHFEHHANFNVPWYLLPSYHKTIQNLVPDKLKPYYFHHDYLRQMIGTKPLPGADMHQ